MFVVLVSLVLTGAAPSHQARPVTQISAPPAREARPAAPRTAYPVVRYNALRSVAASLREATICSAHMELLIEKVSAKGEDVQSPILLIQEYWQEKLPDPDSEEAIGGDVFTEMKATLDTKAVEDPDVYLRQLQACVTEAAQGGALDH